MTAEHTDDFLAFVSSFEEFSVEGVQMNIVEYEFVEGKSTCDVVVYRFLICLFFIFRVELNRAEIAALPHHFLEICSRGYCRLYKHAISEQVPQRVDGDLVVSLLHCIFQSLAGPLSD